jgi:kynureninase
MGEGNCFLRVPPIARNLRPIVTGWFASFAALADERSHGVAYGERAADRFAGSTYDPTSHYRARAVAEFFYRERLDVDALRAVSLRQTERILALLPGFDVVTPSDRRAGFVAVRVGDAAGTVAALRAQNILVDARADIVRLGPAPYLTDDEIDRGVRAFIAAARR